MPSKTFDQWLSYSDSYAAKRDVAGRYGVDFRDAQPSKTHRATLRLLQEAKIRVPNMLQINGEQFDYLDNAAAIAKENEKSENVTVTRGRTQTTRRLHHRQKTQHHNHHQQQQLPYDAQHQEVWSSHHHSHGQGHGHTPGQLTATRPNVNPSKLSSTPMLSPVLSIASASSSTTTLTTPALSSQHSPHPNMVIAPGGAPASYPMASTQVQAHHQQSYYQNSWSPAGQMQMAGQHREHAPTIAISGRSQKGSGWAVEDAAARRSEGRGLVPSTWIKEEPEDHTMDENEDGRMGEQNPYSELWVDNDYVDNSEYWRFNDMRTAVVESHPAGGW